MSLAKYIEQRRIEKEREVRRKIRKDRIACRQKNHDKDTPLLRRTRIATGAQRTIPLQKPAKSIHKNCLAFIVITPKKTI